MAALLEALKPVIEIVLSVLLDLIRRRAQPTAEDAGPDLDTRDKLRTKVREHWSRP